MSRSTTRSAFIVCALLAVLLAVQAAGAQHTESTCDLEAVIAHQNEHAQELADFHTQAETNLDTALATLYRTGLAYQDLAVECGFTDTVQVEATHEAEHAAEAAEHEAAERLEIARSVGDPQQGEILFNTFRDEVSFACATCHRVDTTEQLVGPGLLGISGATHNHSAHNTMSDMPGMAGMAETEEAAGHDHQDAHAAQPTLEATPIPVRTVEETIAYLHTSIVDPGAYVMPGFPDNMMPKVYGEIFTQKEIEDLVAYLLTL